MSQPLTITDSEFDDVINSDKPVLVDFWAEWCGPCRMIAPILEEIAAEHDSITIAKLNIDENPQAPGRYDVMSIPTMIVFQDGVEKAHLGARPGRSNRSWPSFSAEPDLVMGAFGLTSLAHTVVPCPNAPVPAHRRTDP